MSNATDLLDVLGVIPGVSTVVNGGRAAVNLGMAGGAYLSGNDDEAKEHLADAAYFGVGAVPYVGTAMGAAEFIHDYSAPSAREGECVAPITLPDGSQDCDAYEGGDPRSLRDKYKEALLD
jgi:hypothetical protein